MKARGVVEKDLRKTEKRGKEKMEQEEEEKGNEDKLKLTEVREEDEEARPDGK